MHDHLEIVEDLASVMVPGIGFVKHNIMNDGSILCLINIVSGHSKFECRRAVAHTVYSIECTLKLIPSMQPK